MKDLKHYFTENSRSCDTSEAMMKDEVTTTGASNASDEEGSVDKSTSTSKKRSRVKIKISKNHSRGKICDIVESSNDLVDKTPSPFGSREIKDDESLRNETPKRTKNRKTVKISKTTEISNLEKPTESCCENVDSGDENDNLLSNKNVESEESIVRSSSKEISKQNLGSSETLNEKTEREESNAFQVLMTRKKSIQYRTITTPTQLEEELAVKIAEEEKNKLKQNKDKLILLADKKGYSKRKLNELEEAERIEKRLEKRAKVFKQFGKKETDDKNMPSASRRSGNLHSYFSKANTEPTEKDITTVSSMIVEAEVHVSDSRASPIDVQKSNDRGTKESPKVVEMEQRSESLDSLTVNGESRSSQRLNKKPRWSLRINLQCESRNAEADQIVEGTETIQRGRRDSKSRRAKDKLRNNDENKITPDPAEPGKKSKKRHKSTNEKNSQNLPSDEIRRTTVRAKASPELSIESTVDKTEMEPEIELIEVKVANKAEKLAPLFVKRLKTDPAVLEARRAFLQFAPTQNNGRTNDRKFENVGTPVLPFPEISHVRQLDIDEKIEDVQYERIFPAKEMRPFVPKFDLGELKKVTSLHRDEKKMSDDRIVLTKSNIEEVLGEIESRCSDARQIWTRISSKSKEHEIPKISPKRRGKRKKSTEKKYEILDPDNTDKNCAWTEKYRPTSTSDIVGNEEGAEKFRKWLEGWRAQSNKDENSSGDEFYPSDCSYASNADNNQVAVLLGPHGSGKTASVYAIAEELGYSVIEVNASSKRAGKKILKELEEATKSHRIKRQDFPLLKKLTGDKDKTIPQNSLILVEDVDLIFEEDEGFVSATCQLASNTKRPIVMTGRDACPHLNRMAPQQMRIYYQSTSGSRVSALLELITLAESGYRLPRSCLDRLLQNGDLRKALLQLQYLLISGKPNTFEVPTNFHQSLWQDTRHCIYKPAIRGTKKSTKKKVSNGDKSQSPNNEKSIMDNLANDLDKLSFLSTMIEIDDPAIEISSLKFEPSLSLDEKTHDYSGTRVTSMEIAKWLRDRLMNEGVSNDCENNGLQNSRQFSLKKELNVGVNLALSQVSPHMLDRRAMMLDYLSSVRTICRAEEMRTMTNNKRGNRFFHYLQNLRLPALSTRPSILAAACKVMQERNSES